MVRVYQDLKFLKQIKNGKRKQSHFEYGLGRMIYSTAGAKNRLGHVSARPGKKIYSHNSIGGFVQKIKV